MNAPLYTSVPSKIIEIEEKSTPLTHKYMTSHIPGLVQALQSKVAWLN
jgi:hypothetical protein